MNMRLMDDRGLTLVEVVVTILIIGFALVPMMGMFTTGINIYNWAGRESVALNLAQEKMEEQKNKDPLPAAGWGENDNFTGDFEGYDYTVTLSPIDQLERLVQIEVVVGFTDHGERKEVSLVTLEAIPGT